MSKDACCELCGSYTEDPIRCPKCGARCCLLCIVVTEHGDRCVDCDKKGDSK